MQCPRCGHEPRSRLLSKPCPSCKHEWWDTECYTREIAGKVPTIHTVLDVGCGQKGVIGEAYWHERGVSRVYMCDIHTLKPGPPHYTHLLIDAEKLPDNLPGGVDFLTHCGFLEHVEYKKALRILRVLEQLTRGGCFATASCFMREVDYKVKKDGNPHHYYKSFWCPATMEALGYTVDRERMAGGKTFSQEVTWWYYDVPEKPWEERRQACIDVLCARRCRQEGCNLEPVVYLPHTDDYSCLVHHGCETEPMNDPGYGEGTIFDRWLEREDGEKVFRRPPWRDPLALKPMMSCPDCGEPWERSYGENLRVPIWECDNCGATKIG